MHIPKWLVQIYERRDSLKYFGEIFKLKGQSPPPHDSYKICCLFFISNMIYVHVTPEGCAYHSEVRSQVPTHQINRSLIHFGSNCSALIPKDRSPK